MNMQERLELVRRVAAALATNSSADVYAILRAAHSTQAPSRYWDEIDREQRTAIMIRKLSDDLESTLLRLGSYFFEDIEAPSAVPSSDIDEAVDPSGSVFIVHVHDHARLHELVRVVERGTAREATVLREQANSGRTLIEKFEDHAASASFAIVLLTADDEGGSVASNERQPRGRQNVVFELGFFFGKLGRQRVAVLIDAGVERPSDIDGLVYITLDAAGAWKAELAKELTAAGIDVDRSRIP